MLSRLIKSKREKGTTKSNLFSGCSIECNYKLINSQMYHSLVNKKNVTVGKLQWHKSNKTLQDVLLSENNQIQSLFFTSIFFFALRFSLDSLQL